MSPARCPGQDKRYWTADDVFEMRCPYCAHEMEFFKDEPVLPCRSCRRDVRNPRVDLSCAKWCKFAAQCLGQMPEAPEATGSLCERIIERMRGVFGDDERRIDHALKVLQYAESILESERDASGLVVRAAAILHDIGIHEAERKHGSSGGKYQELEGPPIARDILEGLNVDAAIVDHVCRIVANHHSGGGIDTPEFRIVWDADWLVNIPEEFDISDKARISRLIREVFRTDSGKRTAETLFLERKES